MVTYEREKKISIKDKIYIYKYRITEENLDLIRVEEPTGHLETKKKHPQIYSPYVCFSPKAATIYPYEAGCEVCEKPAASDALVQIQCDEGLHEPLHRYPRASAVGAYQALS